MRSRILIPSKGKAPTYSPKSWKVRLPRTALSHRKPLLAEGHGVLAVFRIAAAAITWPVRVIGFAGLRDPLVPVGAIAAIGIEVVEQHEFTCQLALIGNDLVAEQVDGRISVTFLQIAEHLIVRAVLLDDVHHVFDRGGIARRDGNRQWSRGADTLYGLLRRSLGSR